MSFPVHTVSTLSTGAAPIEASRLRVGLYRDQAFPASAASLTVLGSITAGSGYTKLPTLAPSGGTLTAGSTDAASAIATGLKCVTATVSSPGTGVAVGDTFNPADGTVSAAGPYGNGTTTAGAASLFTVATARLVGLAINAAGSGYAVNDTITLSGGTAGTAAVVTVSTVSAGAITAFTISTPGSYTVTASTFTQASTSGSGTGATFKTAVWGANTLTITTAGGYSIAPSATNALVGAGTGSGTGVVATLSYGLGTALIIHSGNYSSAPGFAVTPTDGNGSGASIATGTLGGNGNAIVRAVTGGFPSVVTASVETNSQAATAYILAKQTGSISFAFVPPSTTLAAGTFDALLVV